MREQNTAKTQRTLSVRRGGSEKARKNTARSGLPNPLHKIPIKFCCRDMNLELLEQEV